MTESYTQLNVFYRITLIFGYKVVSYLNIFFTCKNTLLVMLQLYRFYVLWTKKQGILQRRVRVLNYPKCLSKD